MFVRILRALFYPPRRQYSKLNRGRLPPKVIPVESLAPSKISNKHLSEKVVRPFDPTSAKSQAQKQIVVGRARIVDGDTVTIQNIQIRLFGIDAPELNHPYGQIAKKALQRICVGQTVNAEILEKDDHGRTVAICRLDDGRDLSAEMVKQGLAIDWPKFSGGVYKRFETPDARKKLWLADARQKGRMYLWYRFDLESGRKSRSGEAIQSETGTNPLALSVSHACPNCGAEMVRRSNKKTGAIFWGCSGFPKCKGSQSVN